jgi:hypothetical protein
MKSTKLADEVWYFEDAIDDADEFLESLKEWEPNPNQEYMVSSIISTKEYLNLTDESIFKCLDIWYKNHETMDPTKYKVCKRTHIYKRGAGKGYGPHTDFNRMPDGTYEQVTATILAYLCDPEGYEGGEIYFPDYDVTIKPKLGSVVIFGNKVKHGVNDVLSGTRAIASVFLVKNRIFYQEMGADDPKNPTEEEKNKFHMWVPQYEEKNANVDFSKLIKDTE